MLYYSWDLTKPKIFLSAHLYLFDNQKVGSENKVRQFSSLLARYFVNDDKQY